MTDAEPRPSDTQQPRWRPIAALDRRVAGVLVEKAKTTPDQYPMSTNALRSGCNQKNNRYPLMDVELEDVEEALERLRAVGAATEVQGGGRVARYRHYLYEWIGVDKVELAVMAELLLRGAQTEGELRGRASRMEPIPDLTTLRAVLASLKSKGLVIALTPEGRGHVVTHALYEPRELEKVRAEFEAQGRATHDDESRPVPPAPRSTAPAHTPESAAVPPEIHHAQAAGAYASAQSVDQLRTELDELRAQLSAVRKDLDDLWSNFR
jgi:uncharacterized protein YceH (UPF0502 family)